MITLLAFPALAATAAFHLPPSPHGSRAQAQEQIQREPVTLRARQAPAPVGTQFVENLGQWPDAWAFAASNSGQVILANEHGFAILERGQSQTRSLYVRFESGPTTITAGRASSTLHHFISQEADGPITTITARASSDLTWPGRMNLSLDESGFTAEAAEGANSVVFEVLWALKANGGINFSSATIPTGRGPIGLPQIRLNNKPSRWDLNQGEDGTLTARLISDGNRGTNQDQPSRPHKSTTDEPAFGEPGVNLQTTWATWTGGSAYTEIEDLESSADGSTVAIGWTEALDFPTFGALMGSQGSPNWSLANNYAFDTAMRDGIIVKLQPDASAFEFATYISGSGQDRLNTVAIAEDGSILASGVTRSPNWPTTPGAMDGQYDDGTAFNATALRLSPDGSHPIYSTFLTNSGAAGGASIVASGSGSLTIATTDRIERTPGAIFPESDVSLARLNPIGTALEFSCGLNMNVEDVALLSDGRHAVAGINFSDGLALPGSAQPNHAGPAFTKDGFVAIVNQSGTELLAATYWGGTGEEAIRSLAVGAGDSIFVSGYTYSSDFPSNPILHGQPTGLIFGDLFCVRFDASLSRALYSSVVLSSGLTLGGSLTVDASNIATFGGWSTSDTWPNSVGSHEPDGQSTATSKFARLSPDGSRLLFATGYGFGTLESSSLAADGRSLVLGGYGRNFFAPTCQTGPECFAFHTTEGVVQPEFPYIPGPNPPVDAPFYHTGFLARLELLPAAITPLGESGQTCRGPLYAAATRRPDAGALDFGVYSSGAAPSAVGVLLIGREATQPLPIEGQDVFVDLAQPFQTILVTADDSGFHVADFAIPSGAGGAALVAQYGWLEQAACPESGEWTLSQGLRIDVQ